MFPNWTGWKSIKALLFSLVTLNGVLMTASVFSAATVRYAMVASLFFGAAGTIVTTLSGTAAGPMLARRAASVAAMLFVLGALTVGVACDACTPPSPAVVSPTIDTVGCIIASVAKDVAAGDPWSQCVADTVAACGADAVTIATVWGDHVHAEVLEGLTPKMPVPGDGGLTLDMRPSLEDGKLVYVYATDPPQSVRVVGANGGVQ